MADHNYGRVVDLTWGGKASDPMPLSVVYEDGETYLLPAWLEDPTALRTLAGLIEAGPPVNQPEVDKIFEAMQVAPALMGVPSSDLMEAATSLWHAGVRQR